MLPHLRRLPLPALLMTMSLACSSTSPTGTHQPTVASVSVTPGADTLVALGQTRQLSAVAKDASGATISGKTFAWQSTTPGVVSVDGGSGLATAVGNGTAILKATVDGITGQASLVVSQQVASVVVSPNAATISPAAIQQFSAVAKDALGATVAGVPLLWVSSDQSVAIVDNTGKATSRGGGTTAITAAAQGIPGSAILTVSAQVATQLAVTTQPADGIEGSNGSSSIQFEIRDASGALVTSARNAVTLSIANNAGSGTLNGTTTVNAVGGIATFSGIAIDRAGSGYTLVANAAGLSSATTAAFNIFLNFLQVAPGFSQSCGLTTAHLLYCWGTNTLGQVGDGTITERHAPVRVLIPAGVTIIAAAPGTGGNASCALAAGGAGYCWGLGSGSQLGDGFSTNRTVPDLVAAPAGVSFVSLASAGEHTCGLAAGGTAYCWGQNGNHQLGDGTTTQHNVPTLVPAPAGVTFVALSSGNSFTCGLTGIGTVYCWGANTAGALGDGTTTERTGPTLITMPVGVTFSAVATGAGFSCALSTAGAAYCWGDNQFGEIGDGTLIQRNAAVPVTMPVGVTFVALTTGFFHGCGLTAAGAVYCWGANNGQIGDGTTTTRPTPTLVTAPAGVVFAAVTAGSQQTCAVTTTGAGYCWGLGFLGDATGITGGGPHLLPTRIAP